MSTFFQLEMLKCLNISKKKRSLFGFLHEKSRKCTNTDTIMQQLNHPTKGSAAQQTFHREGRGRCEAGGGVGGAGGLHCFTLQENGKFCLGSSVIIKGINT